MIQKHYQLHLLVNSGQENIIGLVNREYLIGRDLSNDIVLEHGTVSRFHATLVKATDPNNKSSFYSLIDGRVGGGSSINGITVNGQGIEAHRLVDGDLLHFGGVIKAIFRVSDSLNHQNKSAFGYDSAAKYIHPLHLADNEATAIML